MRIKRSGGANADLQVIEIICGQSGPQIAHLLCVRAPMRNLEQLVGKNIMKIKNSKKLTLAKETLKILNAGDLARVHSGAYALPNTVLSLEPEYLGNTSNSL
jgi:hypothetical protein